MTPAERKAFAATIRPVVNGQSDKFSWQLYKRVLKRGRERVYISAWDNLFGQPFLPDFAALKSGDSKQRVKLMIGDPICVDGWFHGRKLNEITRERTRPDESYAYSPAFNTGEWIEVTDWFWAEYLRVGRCIIHGNWAHNWQAINRNSRKCAYCGTIQRRTIKTIKTIERKEVWA